MNDVTLITYGHNSAYHILPMYLWGLSNLPQGFKHILVSNDDQHGAKAMTDTFVANMRSLLQDVDTSLVMFAHLDNIFFEPVAAPDMHCAIANVMSDNFDLLKFDRSGCSSTDRFDDVYDILNPGSMYLYSNQPTLWRTDSMCKLFEFTQLNHLSDEAYYSHDMRALGMRGLVTNMDHVYHWPVLPHHQAFDTDYYSSTKVPFINALHAGAWNTNWHAGKIAELRNQFKL